MANASAKRVGMLSVALHREFFCLCAKNIAAQNDRTVRNLHLGMFFTLSLSILFRLILRSNTLPPSKGLLAVLLVTGIPSGILYRHLVRTGTSKRDAAGVLISSGEDLAAKGITELCFDVIYLTCESQFALECEEGA